MDPPSAFPAAELFSLLFFGGRLFHELAASEFPGGHE